jgi:hypothetical protein
VLSGRKPGKFRQSAPPFRIIVEGHMEARRMMRVARERLFIRRVVTRVLSRIVISAR